MSSKIKNLREETTQLKAQIVAFEKLLASDEKDELEQFEQADHTLELLQLVRAGLAQYVDEQMLEQAAQRDWLERSVQEITAQMHEAKDLDAILRLTAQEVGFTMHRPAFVILNQAGWQTVGPNRPQHASGYLFDQVMIQPISATDLGLTESGASSLTTFATMDDPPMTSPIMRQDEVIGQLGVMANPQNPDSSGETLFSEEETFLHSIAKQVSEAIERSRLFEQTQKRAVQLAAVVQVSTMAATTLDTAELMQIVVDLTKSSFNFYHVHIYRYDEAQDMLRLASGAGAVGQQMLSEGREIPFSQEQSLVARAARDRRGVVVNDVKQDPGFLAHPLLPETKAELAVPMITGGNLLGVLDVQADAVDYFSEEDLRIQTTLAAQVAGALQNAHLFQQLEKFAQLEFALSQSADEAEILATIVRNLEIDPADTLALYYLDIDKQGQTLNEGYVVAMQHQGYLQVDDPMLGQRYQVDFLPFFKIWVNNPTNVILISDVEVDVQVDDFMRQMARRRGWHSIVMFPLFSGGRWQGLILWTSSQTQIFSLADRRMFERILEPVAAAIASRRAYLVQQSALAETEMLYQASRQINEANDLTELVKVIGEGVPIAMVNRILLTLFEYDSLGTLEGLVIAANWHSGQGKLPLAADTRYPKGMFAITKLLQTSEAIFFEDIQYDERINLAMLEWAKTQNILGMAILPLWVGSYQLGALILACEESYRFTNQEKRAYISLAQQIAVTIDNQRLLLEAKAALEEVEKTQRRYTAQSWESYRDRHAIEGYESVRENGETDNRHDGVVSELSFPLRIRDQVIGMLGMEETDASRQWLPEEVALVEVVSREMAQAAENLRLLDETQLRAAREKQVNDIGEKIQAAHNLEEALQIAIKEVGMSLQAPEVSVQLDVE